MKSFDEFYVRRELIVEAAGPSCVFTFGRFQPPTRGHQLVFSKMESLAAERHASIAIFTSQSHDEDRNPLAWDTKNKIIRLLFPRFAAKLIERQELRTIFDIAVYLYSKGFKSIIMVVGSDKVSSFETSLKKYNGYRSVSSDKFYQFDTIEVIKAGDDRVEGESSIRGVSGTDVRNAVRDGDFSTFKMLIPKTTPEIAKKIYMTLRKTMHVNDDQQESFGDDREDFFHGILLEKGDRVMYQGQEGIIDSLGCNFVRVRIGEEIKKAWISDIQRI